MYIGTIYSPTAPNPPTGLMVTQVTDTSVIVSWILPTDTIDVNGYHNFVRATRGEIRAVKHVQLLTIAWGIYVPKCDHQNNIMAY